MVMSQISEADWQRFFWKVALLKQLKCFDWLHRQKVLPTATCFGTDENRRIFTWPIMHTHNEMCLVASLCSAGAPQASFTFLVISTGLANVNVITACKISYSIPRKLSEQPALNFHERMSQLGYWHVCHTCVIWAKGVLQHAS